MSGLQTVLQQASFFHRRHFLKMIVSPQKVTHFRQPSPLQVKFQVVLHWSGRMVGAAHAGNKMPVVRTRGNVLLLAHLLVGCELGGVYCSLLYKLQVDLVLKQLRIVTRSENFLRNSGNTVSRARHSHRVLTLITGCVCDVVP